MRKKLLHAFILLSAFILLPGCSNKKLSETTFIVSIAPLKYVVETISCGDFPIQILVPEGSSPETYSPTPLQMASAEKASLLFLTGLIDFEKELIARLENLLPENGIVDLSANIKLMEGTCSHNHKGLYHNHGIDPHIWVSPKQLKIMADNAYNAISTAFPDSIKYRTAYLQLIERIDNTSSYIEQTLADCDVTHFMIYHPALTYYAGDYGLIQIALEEEGKEPSASHMKNIVDMAADHNIRYVMIQREFSRSSVESVAKDIGAEVVVINPLAENILDEIRDITDVIAGNIK